ncbi:MAG: exodeoxyribonuclease VII small subunit [Clostridia bacterium]|nr:exodeoxyribonuclease VII small subunit [Clostridia bacterium]
MNKNKSFEDAINELEEVVEKLEKGELPLDESIEVFQKGIELSKYCSKRLDEVEKKITLLVEDENGNIKEEAFSIPEV